MSPEKIEEIKSKLRIGDQVKQNELGYMVYNHYDIFVTGFNPSTITVQLVYYKGNTKCIEPNLHIPYAHLDV